MPHTLNSFDLRLLPMLEGVGDEVFGLITQDMIRHFSDGQALLHQGDEADNLIVLLRGQVRIENDGIYLVSRSPYDVVGEQAFLNETPRSATVIAQGMVQALVLPRPIVDRLMRDASFCGNLLRIVSATK